MDAEKNNTTILPEPQKRKRGRPPKKEDSARTRILIYVSPHIKEKAQKEAKLAYLYHWIPRPSVSALITWAVDYYLAEGFRTHIEKRQKGAEEQPPEAEEEKEH